jgi:hypothetical protein
MAQLPQGYVLVFRGAQVIVATTPATAGTSSNPQDSSFEDGSQSSLVGASSDEDYNED